MSVWLSKFQITVSYSYTHLLAAASSFCCCIRIDRLFTDVGDTDPIPDTIQSTSAPNKYDALGSMAIACWLLTLASAVGIRSAYWTFPSALTVGSCLRDSRAFTAALRCWPFSVDVMVVSVCWTMSITNLVELIWPRTASTSSAAWRTRRFLSVAVRVARSTQVRRSK